MAIISVAALRRALSRAASAALLPFAVARPAPAQSVAASAGAQVIGLYTHSDLVPGGGTADEVRAVQPVIMLHAALDGRRLVAWATAALDVRRKWSFDAYVDRLEEAYARIVEADRSGGAARLSGLQA